MVRIWSIDNLLNYPGFHRHTSELKAFYEFITENKVYYEWNTDQIVRLLS